MDPRSRRFLNVFAAALALAALAAPGRAQAPRMAPDFYMTVAVAGFERPMEVRQSGLKRRTDVATGAVVQTFISDRARGVLTVMTAAGRRRLAVLFPLPQQEVNAPLPLDMSMFADARLNRLGAANVAGRPCTVWRYSGYVGSNGTACATADGVVLQFKPDGRRTPLFQATAITFARQDSTWFNVPPDYQMAVLPGMGGAAPALRAPAAPAVPAR
ncbi:hypothetical protein [Caulobacter sp. 17J80-11]|uniref:hypothetical protein n=1 Tax=Caulobacter sp. 17J80-11 TaxID=2763502 RepID=UPI0016536E51|nr:hypothetical protein [Caulobacter sp. 17J80-11]MBC6980884.1 hypothetical protein [Caulobacter sp. 17J80-11]